MKSTSGLQIGNWIHPTFPMQIVSIDKDGVCADFVGNQGGVWEFKAKDIEPIALTSEILQKCGFKKTIIGYKLIIFETPKTFRSGKVELVSFEEDGIVEIVGLNWIKIRHVHLLQNFYSVLAASKLTITF